MDVQSGRYALRHDLFFKLNLWRLVWNIYERACSIIKLIKYIKVLNIFKKNDNF